MTYFTSKTTFTGPKLTTLKKEKRDNFFFFNNSSSKSNSIYNCNVILYFGLESKELLDDRQLFLSGTVFRQIWQEFQSTLILIL